MNKRNIDVNKIQEISKEAREIGEVIAFHIGRPANQNEIQISSNAVCENGQMKKRGSAASKVGYDREKQKRVPDLYLLSTLMRRYLSAIKNNELNKVKIVLELSSKKYEYSLNTLFNQIALSNIIKAETWKTKVYFGKVIIRKNDKNEYWVNFSDQFKSLDLTIRCSIKRDVINRTHNKTGAIKSIDKFLNKEVYCFLLGTVQITNTAIYINIKSLDHIACSFDDVKKMSELIVDE